MASLDDQAQVRRERASIAGTGSLFIRVRRGHIIRELSRTLEHLSLIVGTILVFDLLGQTLDLIHSVRDADKVTPSDTVKRVASSAYFTVYLVSTANTKRVGECENEFMYNDMALREGP